MARKKQQRHPLLEALWLIVLLLAMLLAYVAPPLILLAWIFTELRARSGLVRQLRSSGLLTRQESFELARLDRASEAAAETIRDLHDRGRSAGLQYRSDDFFDARNPFARELNRDLQTAIEEQRLIEQAREEVGQRVANRIGILVGRYAHRAATRSAVLIWAVTYLGVVLLKPDWDPLAKAAVASVAALAAAALVARTRTRQLGERLAFV